MNLLQTVPLPLIQYEILSYLDKNTLKCVRLVCKQLEQLINPLWVQNIFIENLESALIWRTNHTLGMYKNVRIIVTETGFDMNQLIPDLTEYDIEQIEFTSIAYINDSLTTITISQTHMLPKRLQILKFTYRFSIDFEHLPHYIKSVIYIDQHTRLQLGTVRLQQFLETFIKYIISNRPHVTLLFILPTKGRRFTITPFLWSIYYHFLDLTIYIYENTTVDIKETCGYDTPLGIACNWSHESHTKMIEYLISKGADLNYCDRYIEPPIFHALYNYDDTKSLIRHGVNINLKYGRSHTALTQAILKAIPFENIQLLIQNGANVNEQTYPTLKTPLHFLSERQINYTKDEGEKILLSLLACEANINAKTRDGKTPLFYACKEYYKKFSCLSWAIYILLENGAEIDSNVNISKPLYVASYRKKNSVVKRLLKLGAKTNPKDYEYHIFTPCYRCQCLPHMIVYSCVLCVGKPNEFHLCYDCWNLINDSVYHHNLSHEVFIVNNQPKWYQTILDEQLKVVVQI